MIERISRRRTARDRSGQRRQHCRGSSLPVAQVPEQVITGWVDAFNARDLEEMLMQLDPRVDFYPLRLGGRGGVYRGHDGVRDWFVHTMREFGGYQIDVSDMRSVGEGDVFAVGSLHLAGERHIGSFGALHRIERGLIVAAYHCLTDPDMIEHLGLLP